MRFGILFKVVALLLLVGTLPLLAALSVVVIGGGELRTATIGQGLQALCDADASRVAVVLRKDAAKYYLAVNEDSIIKDLLASRPPLSPEQIKALDARWPNLNYDSPEVASLLNNSIASHLRQVIRIDPRCREMIITDRFGQVFAATGKPTDYYQADEEWWQRAFNQGQGRIYVSPVGLDESTNTWSIDFCVPIFSQGTNPQVVGVAKAVIDLQDWLSEVVEGAQEEQGYLYIVSKDGTVIYSEASEEAFLSQLPEWKDVQSRLYDRQWHTLGDKLEVITPVAAAHSLGGLPMESPQWYSIIRTPANEAMQGIYRLSLYVLVVGLILIAGMFGLGVYAANRNIVRPLSHLRAAAERVISGDLTHRIVSQEGRLGGNDEVGQLTEDFNRMVVAVAASHAALTEASELKSRFIRVAGHELRTPISYIVSMTALISKTSTSDSVRAAAEKIAARAFRLDQIITQMFKLLGEGQLESTLHYSHFNVDQMVGDVVAELRPFFENRSQKVEVVAEEHPAEIQADREKLHDALTNLMSNAIKFTPDGGTIHVTLSGQVGHRLALRVRDEGSGISAEELPHIFEPFWGAPDLLKHSSGEFGYQKRGPGLGLAIARHFVRLHGGQIQVNNTTHGAEFSILIPVAPPEDTAASETRA